MSRVYPSLGLSGGTVSSVAGSINNCVASGVFEGGGCDGGDGVTLAWSSHGEGVAGIGKCIGEECA